MGPRDGVLLMARRCSFCGLVSAYLVARQRGGVAPPTQPRLPVAFTAFNTAFSLQARVLSVSGITREADLSMWVSTRRLGAAFVG